MTSAPEHCHQHGIQKLATQTPRARCPCQNWLRHQTLLRPLQAYAGALLGLHSLRLRPRGCGAFASRAAHPVQQHLLASAVRPLEGCLMTLAASAMRAEKAGWT